MTYRPIGSQGWGVRSTGKGGIRLEMKIAAGGRYGYRGAVTISLDISSGKALEGSRTCGAPHGVRLVVSGILPRPWQILTTGTNFTLYASWPMIVFSLEFEERRQRPLGKWLFLATLLQPCNNAQFDVCWLCTRAEDYNVLKAFCRGCCVKYYVLPVWSSKAPFQRDAMVTGISSLR